jgi:hypothetical protein
VANAPEKVITNNGQSLADATEVMANVEAVLPGFM